MDAAEARQEQEHAGRKKAFALRRARMRKAAADVPAKPEKKILDSFRVRNAGTGSFAILLLHWKHDQRLQAHFLGAGKQLDKDLGVCLASLWSRYKDSLDKCSGSYAGRHPKIRRPQPRSLLALIYNPA